MENVDFGDSEEQGVTRDNRFYHKPLDLYIKFPENWRVENQPTQLIAIGPSQNQAMIIKLDKQGEHGSPEEFLRSTFQNFSNGQRMGDGSYTGITQGKTPFGQGPVRVAARFHGDYVLLFNGFAKRQLPDQAFFGTMGTVRSLKQKERKLASAKRIKLVRANSGDTFASLASQSALDRYAVEQLRLLNGMYPDGEPSPGQLIKIIK